MAEFPAPAEGIVLTHFIVASDVDRTRRFYSDVLGGEVLRDGEPAVVALANSWIVINVGGPPTDDKPTVAAGQHWSSQTSGGWRPIPPWKLDHASPMC
jgi:catechol 2,3-dioxygenase-like lactoylglutathione lyase family enzyme